MQKRALAKWNLVPFCRGFASYLCPLRLHPRHGRDPCQCLTIEAVEHSFEIAQLVIRLCEPLPLRRCRSLWRKGMSLSSRNGAPCESPVLYLQRFGKED